MHKRSFRIFFENKNHPSALWGLPNWDKETKFCLCDPFFYIGLWSSHRAKHSSKGVHLENSSKESSNLSSLWKNSSDTKQDLPTREFESRCIAWLAFPTLLLVKTSAPSTHCPCLCQTGSLEIILVVTNVINVTNIINITVDITVIITSPPNDSDATVGNLSNFMQPNSSGFLGWRKLQYFSQTASYFKLFQVFKG